MSARRVLAFDSETGLIRPALLAPPLVCVTWQELGQSAGIEHRSTVEGRIRTWLQDPNLILVGHNVAYDAAVLCEAFPSLRPLFFDAYAADRVTDTMIRQHLLDTHAGEYRGRLNAQQVWRENRYDLQSLARRMANIDLVKDGWRMSYGEFLDTPLAEWPRRAREVQAAAVPIAAELAAQIEQAKAAKDAARVKSLTKQREGLVEMIASDPSRASEYPLDDARATLAVYLAQEKHSASLHDQFRQARAAFALHLSSAWGLRTDAPGVDSLRAATQFAYDEIEGELIQLGFVRNDKKRTRDTKLAKARMVRVCKESGLPLHRTEGHADKTTTKCRDVDGAPLPAGDERCAEHVSLDAEACNATDDEVLQSYAEISTLKKVLSNDVEMLLRGLHYPVHTKYGYAETGRSTSCIARGEPVQMPCDRRRFPSGVPIEEVRAGDRVYSYSTDGTLHLQRVLWAGCTGRKRVVRLIWRGQGRKHYGSVRLTADHRVMTLEGEWVAAGRLKPGARLTALSCRAKAGYQHLYARGGVDHREHVFASSAVHGASPCVHHIDHDSFNNALDNLQAFSSQSEHAILHGQEASPELRARRTETLLRSDVQAKARAAVLRGEDHPHWKVFARPVLLRWAAVCKGKICRIMGLTGSDYNVLQRKYLAAGIDLMQVRRRYNGKGQFITRRMVRDAAQLRGNERHKALCVSHGRFKELIDVYGLSGNHEVLAVVEDGESDVFDLEVEHTQSFVAGEICVHNSKPNIQNVGKRAGIRECFIARPGMLFGAADYPALESHTWAQCCQSWLGQSKLGEALNAGLDPHLAMAANILGCTYEEAKARYDAGDQEVHDVRQLAKVANFGFPGGMGPPKLLISAKKQLKPEVVARLGLDVERMKKLKTQWFETWPEAPLYFARINALCDTPDGRATVETLFTKRFRGGASYCAAANTGFQALGADCAKNAVWRVAWEQYNDPSSPLWNTRTVFFVHDEIGIEAPEATAHEAVQRLADVMVEAANVYLPDVPIPRAKMKPVLMRRWSKKAKPVVGSDGRLVA